MPEVKMPTSIISPEANQSLPRQVEATSATSSSSPVQENGIAAIAQGGVTHTEPLNAFAEMAGVSASTDHIQAVDREVALPTFPGEPQRSEMVHIDRWEMPAEYAGDRQAWEQHKEWMLTDNPNARLALRLEHADQQLLTGLEDTRNRFSQDALAALRPEERNDPQKIAEVTKIAREQATRLVVFANLPYDKRDDAYAKLGDKFNDQELKDAIAYRTQVENQLAKLPVDASGTSSAEEAVFSLVERAKEHLQHGTAFSPREQQLLSKIQEGKPLSARQMSLLKNSSFISRADYATLSGVSSSTSNDKSSSTTGGGSESSPPASRQEATNKSPSETPKNTTKQNGTGNSSPEETNVASGEVAEVDPQRLLAQDNALDELLGVFAGLDPVGQSNLRRQLEEFLAKPPQGNAYASNLEAIRQALANGSFGSNS